MNAYNSLILERNDTVKSYRALSEQIGKGEADPKDDEVKGRLSGMEDKISDLDDRIAILKKAEDMHGEAPLAPIADESNKSLDEVVNDSKLQESALHKFLRHGVKGAARAVLTEAECQAMEIHPESYLPLYDPLAERRDGVGNIVAIDHGEDSRGGYTIPSLVSPRITERMKSFGPIRRLAEVSMAATGRSITEVTEDDTGNVGEILAAPGAGNNPDAANDSILKTGRQGRSFGAVTIETDTWSSKRVGTRREFIQDTETSSVIARMVDVLGTRLGRAEQMAFANGSTASGITGCRNIGYLQSTQVPKYVIAPSAAPGTAGTGGKSSPLTFAEWQSVTTQAIDESYWTGSRFVLIVNQRTLGEIRALRDDRGAPIYEPIVREGLFSGGPRGRVDGVPVFVDSMLENTGGASKNFGLFGDLSKCKVRDAMNLALYVVDSDTLARETNSVFHYCFRRMGFGFVTAGDGLKVLQTAA